MSSITVLGASGFIGSHLVRRLKERGTPFYAPGRGDALTGRPLGHVIYSIGLTSDFRSRPLETMQAHVCELHGVLQNCEFDSLLYLSSTRVYAPRSAGAAREEDDVTINPSDPNHLYNISKLAGESLALNCGRVARVARLSNVYGGDFDSGNFLSSVIGEAVARGKVTLHTSLDSEKDYIGVEDVVDGLLSIATGGRPRGIYNLASGVNVSHGQLAESLREHTNCSVEVMPGAPRSSFPAISIERMREEFGFSPSGALGQMKQLIELYRKHKGAGN